MHMTITRRFFPGFNTQPPEGGWLLLGLGVTLVSYVSTHSRLKAAGKSVGRWHLVKIVSTHSRLKAAGIRVGSTCQR